MAQDQTISNDKRQAILQRLRDNRGSKTAVEIRPREKNRTDSAEQRKLQLRSLLQQKDSQAQSNAEVAELPASKGDVSQQKSEPVNSKSNLLQTSKLEQGIKPKDALPTELLEDIKKWISTEEADLENIPLADMEQRRKDLQYRCKWLLAMFKEAEREAHMLSVHIQRRQQAEQQ